MRFYLHFLKIIAAIFITVFLLLVIPAFSGIFPGASWAEATPESQGVNSAKLNTAMSYLAGVCGSHGTTQAVVIRNGYMIWKGNNIDNQHNVWSCSKSYTSTVLGILVDDGKCTINTLAKDYVSSLTSSYSTVKLSHFATMTSGYDASGGAQTSTPFNPTTPNFTPGTKFEYWDAAMNQFGNVLTRIAGEPMETLFKRVIADPISMNSSKWNWGDWGTVDGMLVNGGAGNKSKGILISAREMARFGLLFLNRGNWDGQQLISTSWVDQATVPQVANTIPGDGGPGTYGFNWWCNGIESGGQRKWPNAPDKTYGALGHNNNKCFVIPEWDMVVVRLGVDGNISDDAWDGFFQRLSEGVTPTVRSGSGFNVVPQINIDVFPNPFSTSMDLVVSGLWLAGSKIQASVYDISGRNIANLKPLTTNNYKLTTNYRWHAQSQPAGTYVVKVKSNHREWINKVNLIK
jgi:hypothetical protein